MKIKLLFLAAYLFSQTCFAQPRDIKVPQEMEFAGVQLLIDDYARVKIKDFAQKLVRSESHFTILRDRVYRFFPLMEKILQDESVPDDFKFLAVQESALLADAVSTSNAVGYWQFKKGTALEMGMMVDDYVDERKNIVAATKGAAKYLRRNQIFTKNWIHTLLSYNLGLTGVRNTIREGEIGASRMDIDGNTHWYVIRCLAHKLVFEEEIKKRPETTISLLVHPQATGMTLKEISDEMNIPIETMKLYNKWLLTSQVPAGRTYHVIIPVDFINSPVVSTKIKEDASKLEPENPVFAEIPAKKQEPKKASPSDNKPVFKVINKKEVILAKTGDTEEKLADEADLRLSKFSKYNDLKYKNTEKVQTGEFYYLEKKDKKGETGFHTVQAGETLWQISQKYDIRYTSLLKLNRMAEAEKLQAGRILYLRTRRSKDEPVKFEKVPAKKPEPKITEKKEPEVKNTEPKKTESNPKRDSVKVVQKPEIEKKSDNPVKNETAKAEATEKTKPVETPDKQTVISKPEGKSGYKVHTVAAKETLFSIARIYNVSVTDLRYWNNLTDTDALKTGQELTVADPLKKTEPNSKPEVISQVTADTTKSSVPIRQFAPEELTEHVVQSGESLFRIAWDFGMTVPELMAVNGKTENKIRIGEKLKVKAKK